MHGVTVAMTTSQTNGVGARRVVVIEVTTGGIFQKGSGAHAQGWLVYLNDIGAQGRVCLEPHNLQGTLKA